MKKKKKENAERSGCVPLAADNYKPSHTTINNYMAWILASKKNVDVSTSFVAKSRSRYTSKNSLISSLPFLLIIAGTHYMIHEEEKQEFRNHMQSDNKPMGVKMLYEMISNYYNNLPIYPLQPQYLYSTDDSVLYVFEGKGQKKEKFRLVSKKTKKKVNMQHTSTTIQMQCQE